MDKSIELKLNMLCTNLFNYRKAYLLWKDQNTNKEISDYYN